MKKLKKSLSLLLALVMVFSVMSVGAMASGEVAEVNGNQYATLDEAYAAAKAGDTITLLADVTYDTDREVPVWTKAVNLDLGGHTLTTNSTVSTTLGNNGYKAAALCWSIPSASAGTVTVSNGTIVTAYGAGIYADDPGLTMTLSGLTINAGQTGTQSTAEYTSAVRITGGAKVTIEGGEYSSKGYALTVSNSGGELVIKDGTFTGDIYGIYASYSNVQKTITINGGTINGDIYFKDDANKAARSITINGGTINGSIVNPDKGTLTTTGGTFNVANATQLAAFRDAVNAGIDFQGATVKLTGDTYDLSGNSWTPIGNAYYHSSKYTTTTGKGVNGYKTGSTPFAGTFDGNYKTISNLNVATLADPDDTSNRGGWAAGLFGIVKNGTVKNLTIENATVSSATRFAGAVAGGVTGGTIENCVVTGDISISGRHFVGGIAGMSYGTIQGCRVTATGTISASDTTGEDGDDVGGIVGYVSNGASVTGCTVEDVTVKGLREVGGMIGTMDSTGTVGGSVSNVTVCATTTEAAVNYKGNADKLNFGGLVGYDLKNCAYDDDTSVSNVQVVFDSSVPENVKASVVLSEAVGNKATPANVAVNPTTNPDSSSESTYTYQAGDLVLYEAYLTLKESIDLNYAFMVNPNAELDLSKTVVKVSFNGRSYNYVLSEVPTKAGDYGTEYIVKIPMYARMAGIDPIVTVEYNDSEVSFRDFIISNAMVESVDNVGVTWYLQWLRYNYTGDSQQGWSELASATLEYITKAAAVMGTGWVE